MGLPGPGRPVGSRNPKKLDSLEKNKHKIYAAVLAGALGGDGNCARICLELMGDLPRVENAVAENPAK